MKIGEKTISATVESIREMLLKNQVGLDAALSSGKRTRVKVEIGVLYKQSGDAVEVSTSIAFNPGRTCEKKTIRTNELQKELFADAE